MGYITDLLPLIGVIVGAAIPLVKDWLSGRRAEKLERIKLHDAQKLTAYKRAYKFCSVLRLYLRDQAQSKDLAFLNGCAAELYRVLEELPYYSSTIKNSLIELESAIEFVMNNIMDVKVNSTMVIEKVEPISDRLKNEILSDLRVWEF